HEDPENRKNVEDERGGDDVVEQIAIQVSVTGNCSGGVPLDRARQNEQAGPDSLHNETPAWYMIPVQPTNRAKEKSVACHCVIGACASENKSVVTTKRGDHNRDRHDGGTEAREDNVGCF